MGRLDGKVALITGGGTGIGRATAELFAREGARVVITGRRGALLAEVVDAIARAGGEARAAAGDVSTAEGCEAAVAVAREAFGTPAVLVNNAGLLELGGAVHETPLEMLERMHAVNVRGPFLMTQAVVPGMLEAGGGSIVNVGSILSEVAVPGASAYNMTKGAVRMLTRSTAIDYGSQGIRCNAVCPGLVETPMTEGLREDEAMMRGILCAYPTGRIGKPGEIASAILHLASDESAWTTGSVVMVDGGYTAG